MHRFLLAVFASVVAVPVVAQDLMPPQVARELGLTQAWMRPINAPFGAQTITNQHLFVHQSNPHEYIEIVEQLAEPEPPAAEGAGGTKPPAAKSPRVFGRIDVMSVGKASIEEGRVEATRLATNDIRRLQRRGIKAKLETRKVSRVRLYSIATNGMLESRNAETGELVWNVHVGDRRLPYLNIGVNDSYVSIINGGNLIQNRRQYR